MMMMMMSILVKTAAGKTFSLEVKGSDTIGNVKVKIQAKEHIPFDQQELVLHEMVLNNMETLANLCIEKDSTLTLMSMLSAFIHISITTLHGMPLKIAVRLLTFTSSMDPPSNSLINHKDS
ncbi:putative Ubiquitin-like domain-containing protein [Helianthus anomalus]